ncbi:MAG TPA: hypothetical protein VMA74_05005 [Dyella sp.]|uniref:hypothetical protein n=1 Tax=Dyella sp. TaxID=1869338 RepID=UPI002B60A87F|nr:hypothetical protein [Dyella sp.]HUB89073.1 hypothetical protein [Dyella sp.]
MDAHVPQRQGVVRLTFTAPQRRWPAWLLAIAWALLLGVMPWWAGLPLLLGLAVIQAIQLPRLLRYQRLLRRALRWGLAGLLAAAYRAFDNHGLGLTLAALAALAGFSLLVLLESWQHHKPRRSATPAAASPEWKELALAPIGPADTLIELQAPRWIALDGTAPDAPADLTMIDAHRCRIGASICIDPVEPQVSIAPGAHWFAWPMTAGRGVVLYDRAHDKPYRLRGWQLYGWHAGEAWLSRGDDWPPLALSHVLGQDQRDE